MKRKYVISFALLFVGMLGYQAFLIQRDDKLFKAYYHQKAQIEQQGLTPKEQFCKQQAKWHPDCNVE
jgi:hypothetical protein